MPCPDRSPSLRRLLLAALAGCAIAAAASPRAIQAQSPNWSAVDSALGRKGSAQPGGVYKYSLPRSDLHVTLGRVTLRPALALGSWIAFLPAGQGALMMGDLVLTETEVAPVLARLSASGIAFTAVHNHLVGEHPRVIYVHVHGRGDPADLARKVRAVVALTRTPPAAPPSAAAPAIALDTAALHRALGYGGKVNGGVYQVSVPRSEPVRDDGVEIPPAMGVATALNFQPTGPGRAAATGDFVLAAAEVEPVRAALEAGGVTVTALHTHLVMEEPRLFFMHFWADTDAVALSRTLASALSRMQVKSPGT